MTEFTVQNLSPEVASTLTYLQIIPLCIAGSIVAIILLAFIGKCIWRKRKHVIQKTKRKKMATLTVSATYGRYSAVQDSTIEFPIEIAAIVFKTQPRIASFFQRFIKPIYSTNLSFPLEGPSRSFLDIYGLSLADAHNDLQTFIMENPVQNLTLDDSANPQLLLSHFCPLVSVANSLAEIHNTSVKTWPPCEDTFNANIPANAFSNFVHRTTCLNHHETITYTSCPLFRAWYAMPTADDDFIDAEYLFDLANPYPFMDGYVPDGQLPHPATLRFRDSC